MHRFSRLFDELDSTTKTNVKVAAMVAYFREVPPEDAAWAVYFLIGRRPKRLISGKVLRNWALEASKLPEWLVDDCYAAVGDSAETVSLLLDQDPVEPVGAVDTLHHWMTERIEPLRQLPVDQRKSEVQRWWRSLSRQETFLLCKLLTGGFRVGVSKLLVVRALAEVANLPRPTITHRLLGSWAPSGEWFSGLLDEHNADDDKSRPYPFFLASPLEQAPDELGPLDKWQVEWKWDGIRGQMIRRAGKTFLWARGDEDVVTDRYPELSAMAAGSLPDGIVIDGEILAWDENGVMPFAVLQERIGRKKVTEQTLKDAPVGFLAYDLLEEDGDDLRQWPLLERRRRLLQLVKDVGPPLMISSTIEVETWEELAAIREESRGRRVEGLMLKRLDSAYGVGRTRGDWWKWKIDPFTIDAVLIYAQAGSGRRANLFTDYTFAVWKGDELVPIAKAYSGLSDREIMTLDRWIRRNTKERFGPVRSVEPHHVFEIAFEGGGESTRHRKSGVALRFPRIARWRTDKGPADADKLEDIKALLEIKDNEPGSKRGRSSPDS